MIPIKLIASFIIAHVLNTCSCLTQPSLSNLQSTIVVDYDIQSFNPSDSNELYWNHIEGIYSSTNRSYSAYYSLFNPSYFSFYPPTSQGCTGRVLTSTSSQDFDCEYATNGAFFNTSSFATADNLCIGNLISDGYIWQLPTDGSGTKRANFGILKNSSIITGFIDSDVILANEFSTLITGWGWVVRNGVSNVYESQDLSYGEGSFTMEKAPRTSVGVMSNGTMILLEIDGEEDINAGPDLCESAELLVMLGVQSAINIDGGGSSVSVNDGAVISYPTCDDTSVKCERAVASFTCVKR